MLQKQLYFNQLSFNRIYFEKKTFSLQNLPTCQMSNKTANDLNDAGFKGETRDNVHTTREEFEQKRLF